jgi:hypothetical protein
MLPPSSHGVTAQDTMILIFIAVKTPNLTSFILCECLQTTVSQLFYINFGLYTIDLLESLTKKYSVVFFFFSVLVCVW